MLVSRLLLYKPTLWGVGSLTATPRDTEQQPIFSPRGNLVTIFHFLVPPLAQSPEFAEATSYFANLTCYSLLLCSVSLTSFVLCLSITETHLSFPLLWQPVLDTLLQLGPTIFLGQGPMHCCLFR